MVQSLINLNHDSRKLTNMLKMHTEIKDVHLAAMAYYTLLVYVQYGTIEEAVINLHKNTLKQQFSIKLL